MALLDARSSLIGATLIALGMLGAGWLIGDGFQRGRAAEHYVTLAGIRRASQGIFEILPRDAAPGIGEAGQIEKKVRVVSTIEYLLGP